MTKRLAKKIKILTIKNINSFIKQTKKRKKPETISKNVIKIMEKM